MERENRDFLSSKCSFVVYFTTQESTGEAGPFPAINTDSSERASGSPKQTQRGINHGKRHIHLLIYLH